MRWFLFWTFMGFAMMFAKLAEWALVGAATFKEKTR